ncbi:MAG: hypothetical protein RID09_09050 [Coleofasciculus sp. G1-WW12-02]
MSNSYCINGLAIALWQTESSTEIFTRRAMARLLARLEGGREGFYQ